MNIFDIPSEVRLKIYSELLILSETIVFEVYYAYSSPQVYHAYSSPPFRPMRYGLCPALLRISKRIYGEANTLLYSNNRFQFPEVLSSTPSATPSTRIAPFLHQIGSQASHIRHICIPFPTSDYIRNLKLVRDTCTSIRILELFVSSDRANYALSDSQIAAKALGLLDTHFKNILSLKEVVINFEVYPEQDPSDDLTKKVYDYGWTVKVTKLPKKKWISLNNGVEFDNEEDCQAYDNEQFLFWDGEPLRG